jgi:hypothetical protein
MENERSGDRKKNVFFLIAGDKALSATERGLLERSPIQTLTAPETA